LKSDLKLVVFDSVLGENLFPLTLTRPSFDLLLGSRTLLQRIERNLGAKADNLVVSKYLEPLAKETHHEYSINGSVQSKCVVVNSLISNDPDVWKKVEEAISEGQEKVMVDSHRNIVAGILDEFDPDGFSKKKPAKAKQESIGLDNPLLYHMWDFIPANREALMEDFAQASLNNTSLSHVEIRGDRISVAESAHLEPYVLLDSRSGPIIIEEHAEIDSFSRLEGPCYIGKKSRVKSSLIREGTTIGSTCRVSGEVEESIISDYTNKNHDGFLGHSYVGSWVNLGALTTNSDLKNTYGTIKASYGGKLVDTGMNKVGVFVGDMVKTAIGVLLMSGKSIGVSAHVFGTVAEDVPSFTLYGKSLGAKSKEVEFKSAVETQRRMMARREVEMSEALVSMLGYVFERTLRDRTLAKVKKGKFAI
jgi:UDP-N-acetylglucosamine diphosphorylase / glucose-1-phosphate thymidylyltransferase / UDP-N-acetylgalactosamine diphosphorylase / glucosamine-1-phosphate N-acetyltransferase / galactosamine-1-phosphate N-acetyltransferase